MRLSVLDVLYYVLLHMEGKELTKNGVTITREELHEWVSYYFSSEGPL